MHLAGLKTGQLAPVWAWLCSPALSSNAGVGSAAPLDPLCHAAWGSYQPCRRAACGTNQVSHIAALCARALQARLLLMRPTPWMETGLAKLGAAATVRACFASSMALPLQMCILAPAALLKLAV